MDRRAASAAVGEMARTARRALARTKTAFPWCSWFVVFVVCLACSATEAWGHSSIIVVHHHSTMEHHLAGGSATEAWPAWLLARSERCAQTTQAVIRASPGIADSSAPPAASTSRWFRPCTAVRSCHVGTVVSASGRSWKSESLALRAMHTTHKSCMSALTASSVC